MMELRPKKGCFGPHLNGANRILWSIATLAIQTPMSARLTTLLSPRGLPVRHRLRTGGGARQNTNGGGDVRVGGRMASGVVVVCLERDLVLLPTREGKGP